ncbi:RDD family protein [Cellulomonas shaoxiangyii]|uniref:RDD domain-containing protein n=1 Tax=Cellulomonas shaoxiangyii TaxID=2566013 RepID=A0A4P7SJM8_9CELL|nr:RDD family protein [Cellulomonas shaoxiangyii]QCB92723.1 hypothetical protein E5225_03290 [Cellulomonas shaoxiangyii]TGY85849.1 hypothetical protein E5226_04735 [Cellulomonas shaoxiangyii]
MVMTLPAPTAFDRVAETEYASWGRRVAAALLDSAVLGAVAWFVAGGAVAAPSLHPTYSMAQAAGLEAGVQPWTSSPVLVGAWLLLLALQGLTGQTPGRRVLDIAVVRAPADGGPVGGPPGVLRSILRFFAHLLDAILLVGYLRPLWQRERGTFADSLTGTVVVRRPSPRPAAPGTAWRSTAVTAGAYVAVTVGLAAGVSIGQSAGVERGADAVCALAPQDPDAPVRVGDVLLVRETEWRADRRLWPWADEQRRVERRRLSLEATWSVQGASVPGGTLLLRTTTESTADNEVPVDAGWASVPVERATGGVVDVEVLSGGRPLTSCSAAVPAGG